MEFATVNVHRSLSVWFTPRPQTIPCNLNFSSHTFLSPPLSSCLSPGLIPLNSQDPALSLRTLPTPREGGFRKGSCLCTLQWMFGSESVSHSVVPNSLRPMDCSPPVHGILLCPWNSPGKNTWVGSHSLLQWVFRRRLKEDILWLLWIIRPLRSRIPSLLFPWLTLLLQLTGIFLLFTNNLSTTLTLHPPHPPPTHTTSVSAVYFCCTNCSQQVHMMGWIPVRLLLQKLT